MNAHKIVAAGSPVSRAPPNGEAGATYPPQLITADASKVTPTEFLAVALDRMFPAPPVTRASEQADAARRFCSAAWASDDIPALRAKFEREKADIDARYRGLPIITNLGREGVGI